MIEDVVIRLLFCNPYLDGRIKDVKLELATRVCVNPLQEYPEHERLGYPVVQKRNKFVYLTDADVFRTAIDREMLENEAEEMNISLQAKSIKYEAAVPDEEFLYLADAVCSILGFRVSYKNTAYFDKIWQKMGNLVGEHKRILWSYDTADTFFVRAWKAMKRGELYKAVCNMFEATKQKSEVTEFYKNAWSRFFYDRIAKNLDFDQLKTAISDCARSTRKNKIDNDKLVYAVEQLERLCTGFHFASSGDRVIFYDLYSSAMAAYNHQGLPDKAAECRQKLSEYEKYISIEQGIRNRHRETVSMCDKLDYDQALAIAGPSCEYYEKSIALQQQTMATGFNNVEFGIACSQLGQVYAYQGNPQAEKYFLKALELIDRETGDYFITEAYLLHYYLQTGEREKYESFAKEYFGGKTGLDEQLSCILDAAGQGNPALNYRFALHVYLRAVYEFYLGEIPEQTLSRLMELEKLLEEAMPHNERRTSYHPWEINFKYLALIAAQKDYLAKAGAFIDSLRKFYAPAGSVVDVIKQYGEIEVLGTLEPERAQTEKLAKLCQLIEKLNPKLAGKVEPDFESISKWITFSYR